MIKEGQGSKMDSFQELDDLETIGQANSSKEISRTSKGIERIIGNDIVEFYELKVEKVSADCFKLFEIDVARSRKAAPVEVEDNLVLVAIGDPSDIVSQDDIRLRLSGYDVRFVAVDEKQLESLIARWSREEARKSESQASFDLASEVRTEVVVESDDSGKMAKLVNNILEQAVSLGASDIHIEPDEKELHVRFRVDGVLQHHSDHPINIAGGIVNRIKILSSMEIAERRVPQDGRFGRKLMGRDIDARVVTLPTANGYEGIVMRLFDQSRARLNLNEIGFHEDLLEKFENILTLPHGLILVTGPTGSGKTTTLYASLGLVARSDRKTLTIEDPVEIRLNSITQMQVNDKANLTFSTALKSFLRADPDVMLVGEIRDAETASLASQAALTGHLVLSTLHTNEASGAATRLSNLGLEPFVTASALKAVLAQRLMRRLCTKCAIPYEPKSEELASVHWPETLGIPSKLMKASSSGCVDCNKIGYRGRLPIAELVIVEDELVHGILNMNSSGELEKIAKKHGTISLHDDACRFVYEGLTSIEELKRVGV